MIGASLYSYRLNFDGHKPSARPFARAVKLKLVDLLRPGYIQWSKFNEDLFIGICQWLMKEGYPCPLHYKGETESLRQYIADALFSVDLFHVQSLHINSKFNLLEWQQKFNLFDLVEIPVRYYRNRQSAPIKQFESVSDLERLLYHGRDKYGEKSAMLNYSPNKSWKRARWIISRYISIHHDRLTYVILYGCQDDYRAANKGEARSSWDISIDSLKDENYIDFCLRLHQNYKAIMSGTYISKAL